MTNYSIKILPEVRYFFKPRLQLNAADVSSNQITYTQGYGNLSKAGATVQLGVTGHVSIDLQIKSLSQSFYEDTTKEITNTVSTHTSSELQEASRQKDYKNWWFAFLEGGGSQSHESDYYRKQQSNSVTIADTKYFAAASKKISSNQQDFHVSGDFEIIGQSYTPTTVFLFIETLTIQMSDGTTIVVPTQNIAVADGEGNQGAGTTKGKINITPLS